ncbi:MAG: type VI secretion system ATPase TssH, partial [Desulfuromonas sp.]
MNPEKLTLKSQQALEQAQQLSVGLGHQEVDGEHLLLALLEQEQGLVGNLCGKLGVEAPTLAREVRQELERRPSVSGPGAEVGKIYVTQRLQQLLLDAEKQASQLKDDYVSVEHLFLALL